MVQSIDEVDQSVENLAVVTKLFETTVALFNEGRIIVDEDVRYYDTCVLYNVACTLLS